MSDSLTSHLTSKISEYLLRCEEQKLRNTDVIWRVDNYDQKVSRKNKVPLLFLLTH